METLLDKLEIEEKSPREGDEKELFYYDKSLESIRSRGYERHLRPSEAFKLIIDSLENKNSQYKQIKQDMLSSYGEWLSLVMLRNKDELTCYLDPENKGKPLLTLLSNQDEIKYSQEKKFKIDKRIKSQDWVDLNKFPESLVEFLYSRKYEDLPQVMKEGDRRSQLWFPKEGIIRPCGRGYGCYSFFVDASYNYRASRGVRARP